MVFSIVYHFLLFKTVNFDCLHAMEMLCVWHHFHYSPGKCCCYSCLSLRNFLNASTSFLTLAAVLYLVCLSLQNSGLTFPGSILDKHNLMYQPKHMIIKIPKSPFYLPKRHSHLHHFILHRSPAPSFWTYGFTVFSWLLVFSQNLFCSYLQMMAHFKTPTSPE